MKKSIRLKTKPFLLLFFLCSTLLQGCSSENTFNENIEGPQIIMNPPVITLSIASLAKTEYIFSGRGFTPGESILIEMTGVHDDGVQRDIAIASALADDNGSFETEIGLVTRISEFMRARIDAMNGVIIVSKKPLPEGTYPVRASSLMSDTIADYNITLQGPSIIDTIKDKLGAMLGKIVTEKPEGQEAR